MFKTRIILLHLFAVACVAYGKTNGDDRIVAGMTVPPGEYVPYQVSLQYERSDGSRGHFCGGSIIAANRILTAAHCCAGFEPARMSVVANITDLRDQNGVRSQVLSYDINENYVELVTSDIAILYIDPPLPLNNVTMAAIVPGNEFVGAFVPVNLTGWGLRFPLPIPLLPQDLQFINYPNELQRITYFTLSNSQCQNMGMSGVTQTEICARGLGQAACSGDSGGPLVMSTDNGPRQVGIVSYGLFICSVLPDVYTRVSEFTDWIQQRLN